MAGEDFEIDGTKYRLATLDAMTQFHVTRRLLPVVGAMGGDGGIMTKIAGAVGALTDQDSEYIIGKCLTGCSRQREGDTGWAKIFNNGHMMFADITMSQMVRLVVATLESNLSDFFTELRSGLIPVPQG